MGGNIVTVANYATGVCEAFFLFILFETFMERREGIHISIHLICILLVAIFIDVSNFLFSNSLLNITAIVLFEFLISFLYVSPLKNRLIVVILSYAILYASEMIVLYLMTIVFNVSASIIINDAFYRVVSIIISKLLYFGAVALIYIKFKNEVKYADVGYWFLFFIMFFVTTLTLYTFCKLLEEINNGYLRNLAVLSSAGSILAAGAVLYLYNNAIRQNRKIANAELSEINLREQINHYQNIMMTQGEVKKLKHDIRNHMYTIKAYIQDDKNSECLEYIGKIINSAEKSQSYIDTGNTVIDAILNTKKSEAENKGIEFNLNIKIPENLPMAPEDECIILGNALDNAIEACESVREKKYISVTMKFDREDLICKITNSCVSSKEKNKITTKSDVKNHGFGISNINEALKNYYSTVRITNKNNEYSLFFVIMGIGA